MDARDAAMAAASRALRADSALPLSASEAANAGEAAPKRTRVQESAAAVASAVALAAPASDESAKEARMWRRDPPPALVNRLVNMGWTRTDARGALQRNWTLEAAIDWLIAAKARQAKPPDQEPADEHAAMASAFNVPVDVVRRLCVKPDHEETTRR